MRIPIKARTATILWYSFVVTAATLVAWGTFQRNAGEIGVNTYQPFAWPIAVMAWLLTLGLGAMVGSALKPASKISHDQN